MWSDLLLQAAIIVISLFMFLFVYDIPQKLFSKLRLRLLTRPSNLQAKRHFVLGAQLLSEARSSSSSSDHQRCCSLAKRAESEAEIAISLDPKDAAAHILKALALELQGFNTSALDSLDVALSPLAVKSLSDGERGDALYKRAELRLAVAVSHRHRQEEEEEVDYSVVVVEDLIESVRLNGDNNAKAFCLLGECYEKKGFKKEALKAYQNALTLQPHYDSPRLALARLLSSS